MRSIVRSRYWAIAWAGCWRLKLRDRCANAGTRLPRLLVITGCRPPHTIVVKQQLHALPDKELIDVLQERYGGIPPAVRDNPELQAAVAAGAARRFSNDRNVSLRGRPPLDVPMLVLGGTDDPAVSASDLAEWRRYTTQQCNVRLLPGGHFFLFGGDGSQLATER